MQDFQPERPQVQPEAEENTEYQHELASHDDTLPLGSSGLGLVYDLKGTEHIVSMVVDDFAPVDDTFSCLYHAVGQRDAVQDIFPDFFRHRLVVCDIFHQIIVDIARLQYRLVQIRGAIVDDKLIRRLDCKKIDRVVVSTDSEEIAGVAKKYGADVPFLRPAALAMDTSKTIDAVIDVLERLQETYEYVVLLQPTSPLRTAEDIEKAIDKAVTSGKDVASVSLVKEHPVLMREIGTDGVLVPLLSGGSTIRRQDMKEIYRVNGAVYVNRVADLTKNTSFNDNPVGYVMPVERSIDIDEESDFLLAEHFMPIPTIFEL